MSREQAVGCAELSKAQRNYGLLCAAFKVTC